MPLYVEVVRDGAGQRQPLRRHDLPNDEATCLIARSVAQSLSKPPGLVADDDLPNGEVEFYDEEGCLIISLSFL